MRSGPKVRPSLRLPQEGFTHYQNVLRFKLAKQSESYLFMLVVVAVVVVDAVGVSVLVDWGARHEIVVVVRMPGAIRVMLRHDLIMARLFVVFVVML